MNIVLEKYEDYIKKAITVHNYRYEYLDFLKKNDRWYFKIKCNLCGNIFNQEAFRHIKGVGCSKCNKKIGGKLKRKSKEYYLNKIPNKIKNIFEFIDFYYKNESATFKVKCKSCGNIYEKRARQLVEGSGCRKCSAKKRGLKDRKSLDYYKNKSFSKEQFEYLDIFRENGLTYLKIKCKEHDYVFTQTTGNHINHKKNGCPLCKSHNSGAEFEIIEYLKSLGITNIIQGNRSILYPLEIDIYLPDYNLGIEFDGLYWHSLYHSVRDKYHIEEKRRLAENKGIQLINIYEDDWVYKQDIIKSIIKNKLGLIKDKIYGRKCELKEIDNQIYKNFLEENHIMGYRQAKYKIGLFYNDDLVAVAGFSDNELIRYVIKQNTSVIGGLGKITKWFLSNINSKLFTYVDLDYFNGNSYKKVGFKEIGLTQPKYWYVIENKRESRQKFQKHKLKDLFDNFDENLTEVENCMKNGIYPIYGCSNLKLKI